jgi:hypothetical protein
MNTREIIKVKGFLGKNNVADAARIQPSRGKSFLAECLNTDIDDELMPHRRDGYGVSVRAGTAFHSMWSNGSTCLVMDGSTLKKLNTDYTLSTIRASSGTGIMSYVDVPPKIYLTNGTILGNIENDVFAEFTVPADSTYKVLMPAGHLVEWYNGRLLVAKDKTIWYSDAMFPGVMDERKNFKSFSSRITMMAAVRDGVWVSDEHKTYFLAGADFKDASLTVRENSKAIEGTAIKIDAQDVDGIEAMGMVVIWISKNGPCLGGNEGYFKNLTKAHYVIGEKTAGASILRKVDNFNQYLVSVT